MGKFFFKVLPPVAALCLFFALIVNHVNEAAAVATGPQLPAGSLINQNDSVVSAPSHTMVTATLGNDTLVPHDEFVDPSMMTGSLLAPVGSEDERVAALLQSAGRNRAQLYKVLWQVLEGDDANSADFRDFILATLEDIGDAAPGMVLAALVQDAPGPTLRLRALRLLNEASQELSVDGLNEALDDQHPAVRQSAQALLDGISPAALSDALAEAVLDHDQTVRLMAFTTMEEMCEFVPVWEIAGLIVNDPDPMIRMRALELLTLGDRRMAINHLVFALGDPNPEISALAGDLLLELEQDSS